MHSRIPKVTTYVDDSHAIGLVANHRTDMEEQPLMAADALRR